MDSRVSESEKRRMDALSKQLTDQNIGPDPITCHVLDTAHGTAASGVLIKLSRWNGHDWEELGSKATDSDGRVKRLISWNLYSPGRYKMHYNVEDYFHSKNTKPMFPYADIVFDVTEPLRHIHLPLLVGLYGYTTYRGT